jgi:phosphoribosylamine--glycine ligase
MERGRPNGVLMGGSGGREHALGHKFEQDGILVRYAPGNGGTYPNNVPISVDDTAGLLRFASENKLVTVIGPEAPLAHGVADAFIGSGLRLFGHTASATRLESSKIFAKEFMVRNGILTSPFKSFHVAEEAKVYVEGLDYLVVVKADGLCGGKGVIVCDSKQDALDAIDEMMVRKTFKSAGERIVIEKRLYGTELSYIVITDGNTYIPMATSQDHKRRDDGDKGLNTGGMGAYSPGLMGLETEELIKNEGVERTLDGMRREGLPANGFMYFGLMIVEEEGRKRPYLLEINMRAGDPETQVIVPRMKSDLFPYILATIDGRLAEMPPIEWDSRSAATVIMASRPYPETPNKGEEITGLEIEDANSIVFHSGTARSSNGKITAEGGRVLAVTALGKGLEEALANTYRRVSQIHWPSEFHRTDIGRHGLEHILRTSER